MQIFMNSIAHLHLNLKLGTLSNDFYNKDASGQTIAYARQNMFRSNETIMVYH
jgi:hypothetical protein